MSLKEKLNTKRISYYRHVFLAYLLILCTITTVIFAAYASSSVRAQNEAILNDKITAFESSKNNVESYINISTASASLLLDFDKTKAFASYKNYQEYDFTVIMELLNTLKSQQTALSSEPFYISLISKDGNFVICGNGSTRDAPSFAEEYGVHTKDILTAFEGVRQAENSTEIRILPTSNVKELHLVHRHVYTDDASVFVITSFSTNNFSIILDEEQNSVILTGSEPGMDEYLPDSKDFTRIPAGVVATKELDSQTVAVYGRAKSMGNILFYSAFPKSDAFWSLLWPYLPWYLLALLLSAALAYLCSIYAYRPISRVLKSMGIKEETEERDDVDVMINYIREMKNRQSNLNRELEGKERILRNKYIFDILNGFVWGDKLNDILESYHLTYLEDSCFLMIVEFNKSAYELELLDSENLRAISTKVFTQLRQNIFDRHQGAVLETNENRLVFLLENTADIRKECLSITDDIRVQYDVDLTVALCDYNEGIAGLQQNFVTLSLCLDNKFSMGEKNIITISDINKLNPNNVAYTVETEDKLIEYLIANDAPRVMLTLKNMFSNASNTDSFKTSVVVTLRRLLQKTNTSEDIFGENYVLYQDIFSTDSSEELFQKTKKLITLLLNYVSQNSKNEKERLYNEIFEYINTNYTRDISINEITERYQISASYLNKILKDVYHISFKSYITEKRIKRAKELMAANRNILIKDVAEMLGYNSPMSFIRAFKKSEGISPSQYLENL